MKSSFNLSRAKISKGSIAIALLLSLPSMLAITAHAETKWPDSQDPNKFLYLDEKLETHFDALRMSATTNEKDGHAPWSETYWEGKYGGIAWRYQTDDNKDGHEAAFKREHASLAQLKSMSYDQIKALSPSEKLDIINGDYDYPLTKRVLSAYDKDTRSWEGICHGWGPAAAAYPEPQNTSFTNKDGITIPVGSSDVKALISFYYAWEASQANDKNEDNFSFTKDAAGVTHYSQRDPKMIPFLYRGIGERCVRGEGTCGGRGLNPATFHLALANVIGNYNRSFVVNVVANMQIWNQPAYGYSSRIVETKDVKPNPKQKEVDGSIIDSPVTKKILVNTEFTYVDEPDVMQYDPRGGKIIDESKKETGTGIAVNHKNLAYWLDLDAEGNIVGGKWSMGFLKSKERRSDKIGFAWRASRVPFTGKFAVLNTLYKANVRKTVSYAASRNYTPGLEDTYFEVNASTIPEFNWQAAGLTP
jgi:hypothetical protein